MRDHTEHPLPFQPLTRRLLLLGNKSIEKADFVKSERSTQACGVLIAELFIVKQKYGPEIARHWKRKLGGRSRKKVCLCVMWL